jgi:putative ABC transport system permease protein
MLFAILPALHSTRADASDALKDGGTRTAGGVRAARSRSILIVAQLGLAVMLLVLATLLVQSLRNITGMPRGVDDEKVLTARIDVPSWRYRTDAAKREFQAQLLARLTVDPAIEDAALVDRLPFVDGEPISEIAIEGRTVERPEDRPWAVASTVTDTYFHTMGIGVVAGRGFSADDRPGRAPVAVINKEMATRYFGGVDRAVGSRLSLVGDTFAPGGVEVIGVAGDVLRNDLEGVNPQVFLPAGQRPMKTTSLVVRTTDPFALAASVRARVRGIDPDVPVYELRPFTQALDEDLSSSRILSGMFVSFALLALVLAASGLYAVVSYAAAQRVKEFGVRMALGALPGDITRMMLWQTARLVGIGLALGLAGGRLLAMGATALLYRISPSDPSTYVLVAVTLGTVALLAAYVPARRATAIDPVSALRLE